jgi:predicted nucleic acid-binding protein
VAKKAKKTKLKEFVLDSSVALAWCFPDEKAPVPVAVLDSLATARGVVPSLWYLEVANSLLVGERRKRSTEADTVNWLRFLGSLPIAVDEETFARAWSTILTLARSHNLSAYDASYLELASRRGLPLASLDKDLVTAAKAIGIAEYTP